VPAYGLRAATQEDHPFLVRAHHEGLRPWIEAVWGWDESQQDALVADWLTRHTPQVVTVDGTDAGYLLTEADESALHLHAIVLLARFQRQGHGTRILRDLVAAATARGLPVALRVLEPNPARRLYERLGFTVTGETGTHVHMRRPPDRPEEPGTPMPHGQTPARPDPESERPG